MVPEIGRMKRVGILGGTFDPVHHGHLITAQWVKDYLGLESVLLIPSCRPPHKPKRIIIASADDRLKMLKLATASSPAFIVSDIELMREGFSYSIDTVRELNGRYKATEFVLIIGSDAFAEITTWKDYQSLLDEVSFAVMARAGFCIEKAASMLPEALRKELTSAPYLATSAAEGESSLPNELPRISVVYVPQIEISGSQIRKNLMAKRSIQYLVPEPVREYIMKGGIYRI
ncbi:nicotinate-nucleotide adenylyltransferase [bacterium]|nr:nicotinate-nucleotide adenylyltransferase [bacterium]